MVSNSTVWDMLAEIPDPEIPNISMVDLGVIEQVEVGESITVEILPTFSGCPALGQMKSMVEQKLQPLGLPVRVSINRKAVWTSDRISDSGLQKLKDSGFAPPPRVGLIQMELSPFGFELQNGVECPWCGSKNTLLENSFGPTLCRAVYHCESCRQPFEQFKPV